jgi:hypothetical protein
MKYKTMQLATISLGTLLLLPVNGVSAAEQPPWGQINDYLRITGELRGRYEAFDYFKPALDPTRGVVDNKNDYSFGALRARLGIALTTPYLDGFVQGQYSGLYSLPDNAFGGLPVGPLGIGGAYYRDSGSTDPGQVFLRQAYLNVKSAPWGLPGGSLKAGRFEIAEGLEYKTGDAKFDALKTNRVSQRLIGPFGYTHINRSFDGFSLVYDQSDFNLTIDGAHPTQGGFNINAQNEISKVDLFYTALTSKRGAILPGTEGRLFYVYYGDDRNVLPVDNRPLVLRPTLSRQDLQIHTVGTHLLTVQALGSGSVDALLWGGYQFGDWGNLDHQAYAVDAEVGYQWTEVFMKPWLRAVYYRGSGDDNAQDRSHETFFQVLPTVRAYAKFPYFNMMNIQDAIVQLNLSPTSDTKVDVDFHYLALTNAEDLFYGGAGATSRVGGFGYFGRASGGHHTVGEMVDLTFTHHITKEFSWSFYYAHAFGDDVTRSIYQLKNDADYGFIEFNLNI